MRWANDLKKHVRRKWMQIADNRDLGKREEYLKPFQDYFSLETGKYLLHFMLFFHILNQTKVGVMNEKIEV